MNNFTSALWVETLKMRRSKVPFFTAIGFSIAAIGRRTLMMIILKDPEAAKINGIDQRQGSNDGGRCRLAGILQCSGAGCCRWWRRFYLPSSQSGFLAANSQTVLRRNYWHYLRLAKRLSVQNSSSSLYGLCF